MTAFDEVGLEYDIQDLFFGHYSPFANRLVAEYLYKRLRLGTGGL